MGTVALGSVKFALREGRKGGFDQKPVASGQAANLQRACNLVNCLIPAIPQVVHYTSTYDVAREAWNPVHASRDQQKRSGVWWVRGVGLQK